MPNSRNPKDKSEKVRNPVYMTPAHLRNPLPEGLKGRHGGVVRNACLSEASSVEDSDHGTSFAGWSIRAAGPSFHYFFAPAREETVPRLTKTPSRRKKDFDLPGRQAHINK